GLGLTPFPLPDFATDAKQVVDNLSGDKQTAVVVSERDIAGFNLEITETSGPQRQGITSIGPLRPRRARPVAENRRRICRSSGVSRCAPQTMIPAKPQFLASSAVKSPMQPSSKRPPLSITRTSRDCAFC